MQTHGISSGLNTHSGAAINIPTEHYLSGGFSGSITTGATTASVSVHVGNNISSFSNSQLQPLADFLVSSLVQSQSLVYPVSNSVMAPPSPVPSSNFFIFEQ